jgi:ubiquinone/menaquinone biosynthesis C-methylase UbiE
VPEREAVGSVPPVAFPEGSSPSLGNISLGPDLDSETATRLLGHLEGKRILELGCGSGDLAITLASGGAKVIAVDTRADRIAEAREAAEIAEIKIEFHHGDLADLAFIRNDQIDLVVSIYALAAVEDLDRVFRQAQRVLRSDAPFLLSLPHPLSLMTAIQRKDANPRLQRTYFDTEPVTWSTDEADGVAYQHRLGDLVTSMARSGFRVDLVAEPRPIRIADSPHWTPLAEWVPTTLIVRGRKVGT